VGTGVVHGREIAPDLAGDVCRTQVTTTFDNSYGLPTEVDDGGDVSTTTDDVCTGYTDARNTSKHIVDAVSRTEEVNAEGADLLIDILTDPNLRTAPITGGNFKGEPTSSGQMESPLRSMLIMYSEPLKLTYEIGDLT
jgi:hypothetical protein